MEEPNYRKVIVFIKKSGDLRVPRGLSFLDLELLFWCNDGNTIFRSEQ